MSDAGRRKWIGRTSFSIIIFHAMTSTCCWCYQTRIHKSLITFNDLRGSKGQLRNILFNDAGLFCTFNLQKKKTNRENWRKSRCKLPRVNSHYFQFGNWTNWQFLYVDKILDDILLKLIFSFSPLFLSIIMWTENIIRSNTFHEMRGWEKNYKEE